MFRVVLLPVVKQDIKEAADWYNQRQQDLGSKFAKEVRLKASLIKRDPFIYAIRYDDVRISVLDVFPFMIHFKVDESQSLIIIYAVLHTCRNPKLWKTDIKTRDIDNS